MHPELWRQLDEMDHQETARRSVSPYTDNPSGFTVTMLNRPYRVCMPERTIDSCGDPSNPVPCTYLEQLCILSYLIHAQDLPNAKKLVKAEQLEAGQFFFRGPHGLPTHTLEEVFHDNPKGILHAAQALGGRSCTYGDASVEIDLFARVPVTFIVWARDEEFPARASILFDANVQRQMPLDALGAAVNLAVKAVVT